MGFHDKQTNNNSHLHSLPKGHLLHRSYLHPRVRTRQLPNSHTLPLKLSLLRRLSFKRSTQTMDLSPAVRRSFSWGVASVKARSCSFDSVTAPCPLGRKWSIHTTLGAYFRHLNLPDVSLLRSIRKMDRYRRYNPRRMSFLHTRASIKKCQ